MRALTADFLKKGDFAIDATTGWGNDFMHLCRCCGTEGQVWGFDVQKQAIEHTQGLLDEFSNQQKNSHQLFCKSHSFIGQELERFIEERGLSQIADPDQLRKAINLKCVVFNLGYLPRSDKKVITEPESTLSAIMHSLAFLADGGICAVTLYPGHCGGDIEAQKVKRFLAGLASQRWQVYALVNQAGSYLEREELTTKSQEVQGGSERFQSLYSEVFLDASIALKKGKAVPELLIVKRRRMTPSKEI